MKRLRLVLLLVLLPVLPGCTQETLVEEIRRPSVEIVRSAGVDPLPGAGNGRNAPVAAAPEKNMQKQQLQQDNDGRVSHRKRLPRKRTMQGEAHRGALRRRLLVLVAALSGSRKGAPAVRLQETSSPDHLR